MSRRAIGIVRVSRTAGREGERFASPVTQRERIEAACERDGLELVEVIDELDVSGGTPLEERAGLRSAVEAVEAGGAEVIVVAYFDRLVRSLRVQGEVVGRVEAAGGRVLTVDVGAISEATAGEWLSGTVLGAMNEYVRRTARERSGEAQARAVARGVCPFGQWPPGYVKGPDGVLVVDPGPAEAVAEGFRMRAEGATIDEVRTFLRERGIERTYRGVQSMLESRIVLGEIHFGRLENVEAHPAIVDRALWDAVQRIRTTRGTRPKSDRLLARLGVLRCGICDARMVVGTQTQQGRSYPFYRCPPTGDCPQRMAISAVMAEQFVVDQIRERLAGVEESASADARAREASAALERAQADLDAAVRAFVGLEDEGSVRERLAELRAVRDAAEAEAEHSADLRSALTISAGDWERLTLAEQRALIAATVARVSVAPGRGVERLSIEFIG